MIKLGAGLDAIEVEDGASVPLIDRKDRGVVISVASVGCPLLQTPNSSMWHEVHAQTGEPIASEWENGIKVAIDLAALRRERAPKPEGGWSCCASFGAHGTNPISLHRNASPDRGCYWTTRDGNTPEKQAAFDAAVEAWCGAVAAHAAKMGSVDSAPCGRPHERKHIGKSSAGWCFSLHVDPNEGISTLADWVQRWSVPGAIIRDEYGRDVPAEQMLANITKRKWTGNKWSAVELARNSASDGPDGLARHRIDGRHCIGHGDETYDLMVGGSLNDTSW